MSVKEQAKQLFEYISHVYAIDLPVTRDVTTYSAELWWQADLKPCSQCLIRKFDSTGEEVGGGGGDGTLAQPEPWLSVLKRSIENPPDPPAVIRDWVTLSTDPATLPQPKPSIFRREKFADSKTRVEAFRTFVTRWRDCPHEVRVHLVPVPLALAGWVDPSHNEDSIEPLAEREVEERFRDNPLRVSAFAEYVKDQWEKWVIRVTPSYRANVLYDELYALHQRLSVEGDRIEILWGHLLLAWGHSYGARILHPLFLTPVQLVFDEREDTSQVGLRRAQENSARVLRK